MTQSEQEPHGVAGENPAPDELADDKDTAGWDREEHGRMAEQATLDDAVTTEPYEPDKQQ